MIIRVAVWVTITLIVLIVLMAAFVQMAPVGSDVHRIGQNFFDFLDRITPGR